MFPTQIESGLSLFTRHDISQWHRGELSSRRLLQLIEELPETSRFKIARDRTFRLVRKDGEMTVFSQHGVLPDGVELLQDNIVDWAPEQKVFARIAREVASVRFDGTDKQPDLTGIVEPIVRVANEIREREEEQQADVQRRGMLSQMYRNVKGGWT